MKERAFRVVFLPDFGGVRSRCNALRAEGLVGFAQLPQHPGESALLWSAPQEPRCLVGSECATTHAQANDIGRCGVIGFRQHPSREGRSEALCWPLVPNLPPTLLHPAALLGEWSASCAFGIDPLTQRIVGSGHGEKTAQQRHALVWWEPLSASAHRIHPSALLGSESRSHAQRANGGWIVGQGRGSHTHGNDRALLWYEPSPADCLPLHPTTLLGTQSCSYALDTTGTQVVGYGSGTSTEHHPHALHWARACRESVTDLHPAWLLGSEGHSWATAQAGSWIVGMGGRAQQANRHRALLWTAPQAQAAIDLHAFAPPEATQSRALSVTPEGVVAGSIDNRAALWIPI